MSSYEPLHHKYRPQIFADLVGQEAIATTLTNAIATRRIAPAYLFTGPRGTGKTSSARILAKSLNCLAVEYPTATPCGNCEVCRAIARGSALDVIEIDAASNTGVDNIREIIERAQFAPVQCRYKVYVIDECHMLSVAAFNALLKTLEEPPDRVIFVLATTDPQRVLPTIISRCQRFDYRRIPLEAMVKHLTEIAQKETIEIEKEALTLVAQISNGGLRDAESLLDQLSLSSGTVTPEKVWDLVGAVPERDLLLLLQAIHSNQSETVIESCRQLMNRGREPLVVLQNLASFYLNLLIAKTAANRADLVAVTATTWQDLCQEAQEWEIETILMGQQKLKDSEFQLKNTTQPRLWLEVTLLGLLPSVCRPQTIIETVSIPQKIPLNPTPKPNHSSQETILPKPSSLPSEKTEVKPEINPPEVINHQDNSSPTNTEFNGIDSQNVDLVQLWQLILSKLPRLSSALIKEHGHLISYQGTVATINIKTQGLLKAAQNQLPQIEAAFELVCGHKVKVNFKVNSGYIADYSESKSSSVSPNIINHNSNNNGQSLNENNHILTQNESETFTKKKEEIPLLNKVEEQIQEPIIPEISDLVEPSEDQLKKAVDKVAKFFEGEIVNIINDLENEQVNVSEDTSNQSISDQNLSQKIEQTEMTTKDDKQRLEEELELPEQLPLFLEQDSQLSQEVQQPKKHEIEEVNLIKFIEDREEILGEELELPEKLPLLLEEDSQSSQPFEPQEIEENQSLNKQEINPQETEDKPIKNTSDHQNSSSKKRPKINREEAIPESDENLDF
ncbi:DNA polymerase III subunit gamma/tau [Crocosphaera sp. UHCC 0190]|uniref:DNA polymerase III subunit gamma/tau n=1 Tax=Crocosphaera sp. UHCC 0190 TaxID=3110246 RepID=UPI002B2159D0|nr:DNA polymerase III subunit gamma/tau [Crocosphaera sp. UHCC 0190]MEA5512290.1 DNA polymerase III subunit gamma/tau [Crocosphaera sp. UHCC 0190]